MFVDKRKEMYPNSNILVICCEGNAGFYEIGIMSTPLSAGYSVLGWNHPGFACSTGKPYPYHEQNAIEIVIEFAVNKLNFNEEDILLFGWSIGGYVASWAAMNYPNIKGIVGIFYFCRIRKLNNTKVFPFNSFLLLNKETIIVIVLRCTMNGNNHSVGYYRQPFFQKQTC